MTVREMLLSAVREAVSKYTRLLRNGDSLNSSQRYAIRKVGYKTTLRPLHQSFCSLKNTWDRNKNVNIGTTDVCVYGRFENLHLEKTRNMVSQNEQRELNTSGKESDDLSLPFWIFLWSFLAVVAGLIYSKLNKQREIGSGHEPGGNHTVNDEQVTRKLLNEIQKKDSLSKSAFQRQRSYEIIDGEVRIHYDVSMLDDTLCNINSTNIDSVLKRSEVENIPLRSASLDDLESLYAGKLPLIMEEGDEDLLDVQSEKQASLTGVDEESQGYLHEGKKSQKRTKLDSTLHCTASTSEGGQLHFEGNRDKVTTDFETITQETLIPTRPTLAINDQSRNEMVMRTDNCVEFSRETESDLREIKNEMILSDSSDFQEATSASEENVIQNVSALSNLARNSLHNSNPYSFYKLTQIVTTPANQFTATRRDITKLKSNKENVPESDFGTTGSKQADQFVRDNTAQVSHYFPSDTELLSQQGIVHVGSNHNIDIPQSSQKINIEKDTLNGNEVTNLPKSNEITTQDDIAFPVSLNEVCDNDFSGEKQSGQHECDKKKLPKQLFSGDNSECPNPLFYENKPIGSYNKNVIECLDCTYGGKDSSILVNDKNDNVTEFSVDENLNHDTSFDGKNKLVRNWQSLPSWEGNHYVQVKELNRDSSDFEYLELGENVVADMKTEDSVVEECSMQNVGEFVLQNNVEEACLATFENRIGSRKTKIYNTIDENEELSSVKTMTNSSSEISTVREDDISSTLGKVPGEISKADEVTSKISDDSLVNQNVQEQEVKAECPPRGKDDKEYPLFARASTVKDVLLPKNVTIHDPVSGLKNSGVISGEVADQSLVNDLAGTKQKRIEQNHTKVYSQVEKFEQVKKTKSPLKVSNEDLNLDRDFNGRTTNDKGGEETFDGSLQPQSQGNVTQVWCSQNGDFSANNLKNDTKSEQAIITTPDENDDSWFPEGETNINCVINDMRGSDEDEISCDSSSFVARTHHSREIDNTKLLRNSDKFCRSVNSPNKFNYNKEVVKLEEFCEEDPDDAVVYATQVFEPNASDNECCALDEPGAVYARQVDDCNTVVYAGHISDSENTLEIYCKGENDLKQVYDNSGSAKANKDNYRTTVVYTSHVNKCISETYTNEVSEHDAVLQPVVDTNNSNNIKVVFPPQKEEQCLTCSQEHSDVASSYPCSTPSQDNERRSFMETSFDVAQSISSPVANTISSKLQETISYNLLPLPSSLEPLMNGSLHKNKEDLNTFANVYSNEPVSDKYPILHEGFPLCNPVPEKETIPELWENLPEGETDVDNFNEIDEIDMPGIENYTKTKSVTDLDELLASFGRLEYLSNKGLEEECITGSLSKSVPDIVDSCEKFVRESEANPTEKKNLSLSTPEINSKAKSGAKKVTKIKIVHVKFLEMPSDSENVEEDSFIYEGEMPITVKMKRRSGHFSDDYGSSVVREITQEPWNTEKNNLKQLEFEFSDLFQNTPSPPILQGNEINNQSTSNQSSTDSLIDTDISNDTSKIQLSPVVDEVLLESKGSVSRSTSRFRSPSFHEKVNSSKADLESERTTFKGSKSSTAMYYKTCTTTNYSTNGKDEDTLTSGEVFTTCPMEVKTTSSAGRLHDTIRSNKIKTTESKTKVEYKSIKGSSSLTSVSSETQLAKTSINSQSPGNNEITLKTHILSKPSSRSSMTTSFKYTKGNKHSNSNEPKSVAERKKYLVKSGIITTQSTTRQTRNTITQAQHTDLPKHIVQYTETPGPTKHVTTQARYISSPDQSSSLNSPRHGIKLSEKFHMSDKRNLAQKHNQVDDEMPSNYQLAGKVLPTNQAYDKVILTHHNNDKEIPPSPSDIQKTRKTNDGGQSDKGMTAQSGRLVTVKSRIISDCSSDADSEMSYSFPSPRVKAKRFHRPQVHRIDSASSSEPDSPRRQIKTSQQSMSELFGVDGHSSDTSGNGMGNHNSLRSQKLFSRFGNIGQRVETIIKQDETFLKSIPSYVHETKANLFYSQPTERNKKQNNEGRAYGNTKEHVNSKNVYTVSENVDQIATEPPLKNAQKILKRNEDIVFRHPKQPNTCQKGGIVFDQRSNEDTFPPSYMNALENNLSPTSFIQEGNLGDGEMLPRTMEFNPFDDKECQDGIPNERCHSPSSVCSDTSSVFSFNCDFDPMPPPNGPYEQEVYTCENPMCKKKEVLLGPEKTSFKSCPACFTYYCNNKCRKLHWPSHKQSCYFGRVNTYVRSIVRLCQRREDLSMNLSQLARDGYTKKGRGVVMAIFNNAELAREFITKGHDAFSGRKLTYSSLAELHREGIISKHRVALMQAVRDYEPNQEFVFNIAVVANGSIPSTPAPRYKLNTVLHCIKMPLNNLILARQPRDHDKVETRLFALPKCSRHEFVNEMEARRHYCRNLSKNLRQYNIKLKDDYPECYKKLCMYVEHNISFKPVVVYGQRGGISYKCVVAPEQNYPLNAEYC